MKIEVKDVCKSFRKKQVLDNVNYTFSSGNIYGLSGINGVDVVYINLVLVLFYMIELKLIKI